MSFSQDVIRKYGLKLSKKYGQNFLVDERIVEKIIDGASLSSQDLVFEIGPGAGTMTKDLCKSAGYVVAVEIDQKLIGPLKKELGYCSNLEIVHGDALKFDFTQKVKELKQKLQLQKVKVVANLPYYITTPLIMMFLEKEMGMDELIFMVQKEVAQRMIAKPGTKDYGMLTVSVSYYSNPILQFDVPPEAFVPKPDVTSSVIKLCIYKTPPVKVQNKELMFKVIKAAFIHRRKTLLNCLAAEGSIFLSKEEIGNLLKSLGISPSQRGETLSLEDFARLSNEIRVALSLFE
jgi:16S rRNA (adenine1518-N6/adenine1519-N6)-dimethyltransferase